MHDHDQNSGARSMMWMMAICCALPLVLILIFGAGGKAIGAPSWIIFGVVAVMMIVHFLMMGRSHKDSDEDQNHSGHGRCH